MSKSRNKNQRTKQQQQKTKLNLNKNLKTLAGTLLVQRKQIKRSVSVTIRETQIKNIQSYHLTPVSRAVL